VTKAVKLDEEHASAEILPKGSFCVDSCSGGLPVLDPFTRECIAHASSNIPPPSKYTFRRTDLQGKSPAEQQSAIFQDSLAYISQLAEYRSKDKDKYKHKQWITKSQDSSLAAQCSGRGELVEVVRDDGETVYRCECIPNHYGKDCSVPYQLYAAAQGAVQRMIEDLDKVCIGGGDDCWRTIGNLGGQLLSGTTLTILEQKIAQWGEGGRDLVLGAIDSIAKAEYALIHETRQSNTIESSNTVSKAKKRLFKFFEWAQATVFTRANSWGLFDMSGTSSFQVVHAFAHPNLPANPKQMPGVGIYPSDLDGRGGMTEKTVWIGGCEGQGVILWSIASEVWRVQQKILSEVVSVSVGDDCKQQSQTVIRFPLRAVPADNSWEEKIQCASWNSEGQYHPSQGSVETVGRDPTTQRLYVHCRYPFLTTPLHHAVILSQGHTWSHNIHPGQHRQAMERGDSYPLGRVYSQYVLCAGIVGIGILGIIGIGGVNG